MSSCLKVNRSCYYQWCHLGVSNRVIGSQKISEKIKKIFIESRKSYGTRRIKYALAQLNCFVSRRRIGDLMKQMSLFCKTKRAFKATTDSKHNNPIAGNVLNRQFNVNTPDQCYVGDITYIYTEKGWLYLAVVIDLFSRKVVGGSLGTTCVQN